MLQLDPVYDLGRRSVFPHRPSIMGGSSFTANESEDSSSLRNFRFPARDELISLSRNFDGSANV